MSGYKAMYWVGRDISLAKWTLANMTMIFTCWQQAYFAYDNSSSITYDDLYGNYSRSIIKFGKQQKSN